MKQVVARAGKVEVVEVPKPSCPENGVLVRTEWSVISTGTESWAIGSTEPIGTTDVVKSGSLAGKAYRLSKGVLRQEGVGGLWDYVDAVRHPELPLGYSSAGTVTEVGREVTDLVTGDRVACAGEATASHSEYASVPRKLAAKVPEGLPTRQAAFSTIGAIALHAVRTANVQVGESVGVMGAGLVGNLVGQIAKAAGGRLSCFDLREDRLELAKSTGADLVVKADDEALTSHVMNFTDGVGLDHVFICAASESSGPINDAAKLARNRGQVIVVGRVGMGVERKEFYQKELKLLMTRSLGPGRYDPTYEERGVDYPIEYVRWTLNRNMGAFMRLLNEKRVNVEALVSEEFPLASASQAYAALGSSSRTAVLLRYETLEQAHSRVEPAVRTPRSQTAGRISVALVGPGAFAKETMIPLLRASPEYALRWLVSSDPVHAKQLTTRYRFEKSTCDLNEALADPAVSLVVITAPNNLHFQMLESTMRAGKLALLEKPLCVTREEFERIKLLQAETKLPVIVGFNRRYAPLVLEMKKRLQEMDGPFVLNYRVNAGFVPASKWSQDPNLGGGRVIHECCHFFDLFNFLLGQTNPRIVAESAGVSGSNSVARDNISVSLRYPNGSLANLVYVAMGGRSMDRERLEVHGQRSSFVLDDFINLEFFGGSKQSWRLPRQDKGHHAELEQVANKIHGKPTSLISTEEVFNATELTFRVDEAIRGSSPS